ncbi:MAG: sensory histidine kinase AtoS [Syntrophorhabdus sp. PtaU1.Bin153]|nr:MAG: sensory histidine kinase AtoS [Syntrophorhabdus sp. PtaU1.Bin153]
MSAYTIMTLKEILEEYRNEIIQEWAHRLHEEVSPRYSDRPLGELIRTTSEAGEAYYFALVHDDFTRMDAFIEKITRMRLQTGFSLPEVQKAFELYRTVLLRIVGKELESPLLLGTLQKINSCLSYTILKFSDFFQSLHEKVIRDYAENLEREVEKRTAELAASQEKYRVLVEDINDGYFVVNRRGLVAFANKAFCDMHGDSMEEVIGRPYQDFVAPESLPEVSKIREERTTTGRSKEQYVYLRRCRDGTYRYTENKVQLVTFEEETATAGICRDITERVEMEKRRLRLAELENENKRVALETLRQLMVTLSHHLLNANTIIGGMVRRCRRAKTRREMAPSLRAIEDQAKRTEIVITALKKVTDVKTASYTPESNTLMIDVAKEIDEALMKGQGPNSDLPPPD